MPLIPSCLNESKSYNASDKKIIKYLFENEIIYVLGCSEMTNTIFRKIVLKRKFHYMNYLKKF